MSRDRFGEKRDEVARDQRILRYDIGGQVAGQSVQMRAQARGGARRTSGDEMQMRFESGERVVARWASITRAGIQNLLKERR